MAKQTINIGASPNDGTGTPLRTAFDYTNQNFTELYTATGPSGNNIVVPGSATITGDLTVDTNVLKVDTTNNRVGINTATPAVDLHIQAAGSASAEVRLASATRSYNIGSTGSGYGSANNLIIYDLTGAAERYRLDANGNHFWNNVGGVAGTAMTLNSTGLGVGASPASALSFPIGTTRAVGMTAVTTHAAGNVGTLKFGINDGGADFGGIHVFNVHNGTYSSQEIGFFTGEGGVTLPTQRVRIDKLGNVIFSTPSTPPTLATNGQLTVNATSNTNLRFSYRGSDGTTRVANITLA